VTVAKTLAAVAGIVGAYLLEVMLVQGVALSTLAGALTYVAIVLTTLSALALLAYALGLGCRWLIDYGEVRP